MTDGESIADVIRWGALNPASIADSIGESIDRAIAVAVARAHESAAIIADEVAAKHREIPPQGRYTADYRAGASDTALHIAAMIRRESSKS